MFKLKFKQNTRIMAVLLTAVILIISFLSFGTVSVLAETQSGYSDVLDDLHIDSSFNESNYPEVEDDYSLQVIQIAESTDGELLIYVYQPSGQAKNLTASSINISQTINDDISYFNYKLQLLNANGVFFKYAVQDLKVGSAEVRYYVISSIYRPFDETIDKQADNDNIITEVNYSVSKQYAFGTVNGNSYCNVVEIETIEITDKFVGLVRYSDGYKFYPGTGACDSHFVAFNTDKPIDKLIEADVYYTNQSYKGDSNISKTFGDCLDGYAYLKYTDKVEHNGGGLFAGTYTWDRIETVEDFLSDNDVVQNLYSGALISINVANEITEEGKTALKGKQWVLRFAETSYTKSVLPGSYGTVYTEELTLVGDVTILRLKFETDGITYNLGVIDNKQTGSREPINNETVDVNFDPLIDWLKKIFAIIAAVLLFIVFVVLFPPVWAFLKFIFNGIVRIICLPFKILGWVFGKG